MRFATVAAGLAGAALLAGCAQINAVTKALTYNQIAGNLTDAEGIAVTMPTSGTAEYSGIAAIGATSGASNVALVGDAALTADFDGGTVTGSIDNFIGAETNTDITTGDLQGLMSDPTILLSVSNATGSVDVTNGAIAGSTFTADFDGDVTLDGSVYSASGTMGGDFSGANGELIEATATGADIAVTVDGVAADSAGLYLAAEAN